ncbi:MAG: phosphoribosylglycinamide formyltransferase [Gammaproteobacteria bacterium]|nr:phosphoribosylglycinamide formyltransferase [Gammaproteobacteria bacterium]MYD76218.1 phosphoribosylglycinamide formyltransferase [Gammaproteobacteria bacterium]MYJ51607.1 phosphoribosylglycinamide formyltransferase [Gammaproteobacteria bacterium]
MLPAIVILASGSGSNLQSIIDNVSTRRIRASIAAVISDNPDAYALQRAHCAGIGTAVVNRSDYPSRNEWESALSDKVYQFRPALVVLAGFMRVLSGRFVDRFEKRIMNIHPSLLPAHRGLDTHRRAIEAGDSIHGATVHFVTPELDDGPIIIQSPVRIEPGDSAETLAKRVLEREHVIYPEAIRQFVEGLISFDDPACR